MWISATYDRGVTSSATYHADLGKRVLEWGGTNLRDLPWRRTREPWVILVSETMLQQTQVSRVSERLPDFLERFPDPSTCAAAGAGEVVAAWAGLGYNRRPLMLHRAAVQMVALHAGAVPSGLTDLLALPGVGPYTARAVRAFAFELPAAVVDTSIGRVYARLLGRRLTSGEVQQVADYTASDDEPWLWNQSIMELGAIVCTKRSPSCGSCPVDDLCAWRGVGDDPAMGSAGVSVPQAPFEGSDRQLRGRLVDAMRRGPVRRSDLPAVMQTDNERAGRVLAGLERDGLAVVSAADVRLP